MNRLRLAIGAWASWCALAAHATPNDFARASVLPAAESPVAQRSSIPQDVYEWVLRDDLGDVRVLNGAGDELPYAFRVPAGAEDDTEWVPLPLFPLPASGPSTEGAPAVNIELGQGGAVVAVHGATTQTERAGYLIDASSYRTPVQEIEVAWSGPARDFLVETSVAASDDLNAWRTVVPSATLAWLQTGGQWVKLDRIELPGTRAKYLKIDMADDASLRLERVSVRSKEATAPAREWKELQGVAADGGFEFDTGGRFPVDRLAVELERPTYLVEARLFSRPNAEVGWRDRGAHTFYRAAAGDAFAASDAAAYDVSRDRFWRVQLARIGDVPRLRIGWVPHELVFLVQGEGPYTLAYGRADIDGNEWPIRDLLQRLDRGADLDSLPLVAAGAPVMSGGPERLEPAPEPLDWRTLLLWAVLVIGVLVVGGLAVRLLRAAPGT